MTGKLRLERSRNWNRIYQKPSVLIEAMVASWWPSAESMVDFIESAQGQEPLIPDKDDVSQ